MSHEVVLRSFEKHKMYMSDMRHAKEENENLWDNEERPC